MKLLKIIVPVQISVQAPRAPILGSSVQNPAPSDGPWHSEEYTFPRDCC